MSQFSQLTQIMGLVEWVLLFQHRENFFEQRRSNGMDGLVAIVSLAQQRLDDFEHFGGFAQGDLVLDCCVHLNVQDGIDTIAFDFCIR